MHGKAGSLLDPAWQLSMISLQGSPLKPGDVKQLGGSGFGADDDFGTKGKLIALLRTPGSVSVTESAPWRSRSSQQRSALRQPRALHDPALTGANPCSPCF